MIHGTFPVKGQIRKYNLVTLTYLHLRYKHASRYLAIFETVLQLGLLLNTISQWLNHKLF